MQGRLLRDVFAVRMCTVFERGYIAVSVCMPSRTALLTSRRPDTTRNWQISQQEFFRDSAAPSAARTSAAARAAWRTR